MTPKTINMDNLKLLAIVTGEGEFVNKNLRTGLWLSELTHIYHGAKKQGIEITVASPKGGDTPIDPESLNPLLMDEITKTCWEDSIFKNVLQHTKSLDEVSEFQFDCVYLAGGHGSMYDFPDNKAAAQLAELALADEANIVADKIFNGLVEGRVSKQLKEICLMDQVYVKAEDGKQSVAKYLAEVAKANGAFTVKGYVRFETGEGLEKKNEDFAAEVAAQLQ